MIINYMNHIEKLLQNKLYLLVPKYTLIDNTITKNIKGKTSEKNYRWTKTRYRL